MPGVHFPHELVSGLLPAFLCLIVAFRLVFLQARIPLADDTFDLGKLACLLLNAHFVC